MGRGGGRAVLRGVGRLMWRRWFWRGRRRRGCREEVENQEERELGRWRRNGSGSGRLRLAVLVMVMERRRSAIKTVVDQPTTSKNEEEKRCAATNQNVTQLPLPQLPLLSLVHPLIQPDLHVPPLLLPNFPQCLFVNHWLLLDDNRFGKRCVHRVRKSSRVDRSRSWEGCWRVVGGRRNRR